MTDEISMSPTPSTAGNALARALTVNALPGLSEVPTEVEWFANILNPNTRRGSKTDAPDQATIDPTASTTAGKCD